MIYNVYTNTASCEMAIFTHSYKKMTPMCEIEQIPEMQVWSRLHATNHCLFALAKPMVFKIICWNESSICKAKGAGVISLDQKCTFHSESQEIAASTTNETTIPITFTPEINITDIVKEIEVKQTSSHICKQEETDSLMGQLENALEQQKRVHTKYLVWSGITFIITRRYIY